MMPRQTPTPVLQILSFLSTETLRSALTAFHFPILRKTPKPTTNVDGSLLPSLGVGPRRVKNPFPRTDYTQPVFVGTSKPPFIIFAFSPSSQFGFITFPFSNRAFRFTSYSPRPQAAFLLYLNYCIFFFAHLCCHLLLLPAPQMVSGSLGLHLARQLRFGFPATNWLLAESSGRRNLPRIQSIDRPTLCPPAFTWCLRATSSNHGIRSCHSATRPLYPPIASVRASILRIACFLSTLSVLEPSGKNTRI